MADATATQASDKVSEEQGADRVAPPADAVMTEASKASEEVSETINVSEAGAAAGTAQELPPIQIAGRSFANREALNGHIKALQASCTDAAMLGPEDALFLFHLSTFHPNFLDKMTAPVTGFKYAQHQQSGLKCFFVVRSDGTEEGVSVSKCIEAVVNRTSNGTDSKKRVREEGADADEPAAHRPKREIQAGCVLVIDGVPAGTPFGDLKDVLGDYGDVRFVEIIKADGGGMFPQAKQVDTKKDEPVKGDEGDAKQSESKDAEAEAKPADNEAKPAEAETKPAEAEAKPAEAETKPAENAGDDDDGDDNDEKPVSARARFGDADGAKKAAAELKEIAGHPVTARVLVGDEEQLFWKRLWERSDANKGGGKGKGKSKGKGKKGKGKGKGKW